MLLISQARQEAKKSGHNLVGTEHLLIAVVATADAELLKTLGCSGVDEIKVRTAAQQIAGAKPSHERDDLDFTPRVQRIFRKACTEADLLGDRLIEPKHIVIAILREDAGIATRILERVEANTTTLLKALLAR